MMTKRIVLFDVDSGLNYLDFTIIGSYLIYFYTFLGGR